MRRTHHLPHRMDQGVLGQGAEAGDVKVLENKINGLKTQRRLSEELNCLWVCATHCNATRCDGNLTSCS
jgi:hypothetical protein